MTDAVYHFTDTARLPWIIATGELRPSENVIGDFPKDFVWATTSEIGDRTSSAQHQQKVYRANGVQLIRFTLPGSEFGDWRTVLAQSHEWSNRHIEMLLRAAKQMHEDGTNWRARIDPLPISAAIAVHAKKYGGQWVPIDATREYCFTSTDDPTHGGFVINEQVYCSRRFTQPNGADSYGEFTRTPVKRRS